MSIKVHPTQLNRVKYWAERPKTYVYRAGASSMGSMNPIRGQLRLPLPGRTAPAIPALSERSHSSLSLDNLGDSNCLTNENTYANVSFHESLTRDPDTVSQSGPSLDTIKSIQQ